MAQGKKGFTKYCLTIQNEKNSNIYENIQEYIKKSSPKFYAYIKHEKDDTHENEHIHLILDFGQGNTKSYEDIHNLYPNCHEEEIKDIASCCAYLTHETEQAKKDNKKLYDRKSVITNNFDLYNCYANKGSVPIFDSMMIEAYILEDNLHCYIDFCKKFGATQVQPYLLTIKEYLNHFNTLEKTNMNYEAIIKLNLINTILTDNGLTDRQKILKIYNSFNHGLCKL